MLPPCSSSLVSSSHSYDETITIRHPRNDAAACVRCVLHPLHLPLSSCLGYIPPLIGLPFLRFYAVVSSLFVCVFFFFCLSRRRPLLATFLSVLFCLLSLLISERFSGLIWFGSGYLVTTAGFVAQFERKEGNTQLLKTAQLTTCRPGNLTRLIHTLAIYVTTHTCLLIGGTGCMS